MFDAAGHLRHDGGVVDAPGVYFLGASFLRRRRSSFLHGSVDDTRELADHLVGHLAGRAVDQRFVPMYPNSWTSPRKVRPSRTCAAASSVARLTNSSSPMLWIAS